MADRMQQQQQQESASDGVYDLMPSMSVEGLVLSPALARVKEFLQQQQQELLRQQQRRVALQDCDLHRHHDGETPNPWVRITGCSRVLDTDDDLVHAAIQGLLQQRGVVFTVEGSEGFCVDASTWNDNKTASASVIASGLSSRRNDMEASAAANMQRHGRHPHHHVTSDTPVFRGARVLDSQMVVVGTPVEVVAVASRVEGEDSGDFKMDRPPPSSRPYGRRNSNNYYNSATPVQPLCGSEDSLSSSEQQQQQQQQQQPRRQHHSVSSIPTNTATAIPTASCARRSVSFSDGVVDDGGAPRAASLMRGPPLPLPARARRTNSVPTNINSSSVMAARSATAVTTTATSTTALPTELRSSRTSASVPPPITATATPVRDNSAAAIATLVRNSSGGGSQPASNRRSVSAILSERFKRQGGDFRYDENHASNVYSAGSAEEEFAMAQMASLEAHNQEEERRRRRQKEASAAGVDADADAADDEELNEVLRLSQQEYQQHVESTDNALNQALEISKQDYEEAEEDVNSALTKALELSEKQAAEEQEEEQRLLQQALAASEKEELQQKRNSEIDEEAALKEALEQSLRDVSDGANNNNNTISAEEEERLIRKAMALSLEY